MFNNIPISDRIVTVAIAALVGWIIVEFVAPRINRRNKHNGNKSDHRK